MPAAPSSRARRHWRLRAAAALIALAGVSLASAQYVPIPQQAYPGDHVYAPLAGGGACNAATLDPARPPQVRLVRREASHLGSDYDYYHYEVTYWLTSAFMPVCGTPPGPPIFRADVGALARGMHTFRVIGHLDGMPFADYQAGSSWVRMHPGLPPDVSGLWVNPTQGGRGLSVMPIGVDGTTQSVTMIWYTQDQSGNPLWMVATGAPLGEQAEIAADALVMRGAPLGTGPSSPQAETWGRLRFSYVGCGRARLDWTPLDTTLAPGSVTLGKLAQSTHEFSSRCTPYSHVPAQWIVTQ